ncbi:MAG: TenA family transcriptional regulator [Pseudomonadota bacterium]
MSYKAAIEVSQWPDWAESFWQQLVPLKDQVAEHELFVHMAGGTLPLERFRHALLNFYPLVENFPKYMALNLAKTQPGVYPGHEDAKRWLIDNIKVEQNHARWYRDWATGFGVDDAALDSVRPSAGMDAVNHYLWQTGYRGSLEQGLAATNLAIEWATGEWSQKVAEGITRYAENREVVLNQRTKAWLRAHASYDDEHPYEAMELIVRCATTDSVREATFLAAQRGLEYYLMALDHCMDAD